MVDERRGALGVLGFLVLLVGGGVWGWKRLDSIPTGAEVAVLRPGPRAPGTPRTGRAVRDPGPVDLAPSRAALADPTGFQHTSLADGRVVGSADREPIPGARVELREVEGGRVLASAMSQPDGRFDLPGRDDLLDSEGGPRFVLDVEAPGHQGGTWLLDGSTLPLGDLPLEPGASLEVRLWIEGSSPTAVGPGELSSVWLQGTAVDESGEPIGFGATGSPGTPIHFVNVPPGIYALEAWAPGGGTRRRSGISLGAGETKELDFTLFRGSRLRGRVTSGEAGVSEPDVMVRARLQPPLDDSPGDPRVSTRTARTDKDGNYRIDGLGTGAHRVEFTWPRGDSVARRVVFTDSGTEERLDLVLGVPRRILGRALDPDGQPLEGALITALPGDAVQGLGSWIEVDAFLDHGSAQSVRSGADGSFELEFLDSRSLGKAMVVGVPPSTRGELGVTAPMGLGPTRGGTANTIEVRYSTKGVCDVVLEDGDGKPVAGATLRLWTGIRPPHLAWGTASSSSEGRARLGGIPGQPMLLGIEADGYRPITAQVHPGEDGSTSPARIHLGMSNAISVFVRDAEGRVLPGASVLHRREPASRSRKGGRRLPPHVDIPQGDMRSLGVTDAAGHLSVEGLRSGRHRFRAAHPMHGAGRASVQVTSLPGVSSITLELEPARMSSPSSARLRLGVDAGVEPPGFVRIEGLRGVHVDRIGDDLLLTGIEAGHYQPTLTAEGFVPAALGELSFRGGEEVDLGTVALRRGQRVTVAVVDENDEPVRGARVAVFRDLPDASVPGGQATQGTALTETRPGRYSRNLLLPADTYRVVVRGRGRTRAQREFTLEPGEDSVIRIRSSSTDK